MQNKPGYILFLLFSILSLCSVLISLYFSRVIIYRQLIQTNIKEQQCQQLAISCLDLGQSLLIPEQEEKKEGEAKTAQETIQETLTSLQKTLIKIFPYLNKEKSFDLKNNKDLINAQISLSIISEHGKLNLNSLYDFEKKKFINEGKPNDAKKLCTWLFNKIAQITGKPNLFAAFENILKNRTSEFNDPLELLADASFSEQFNDENIFIHFEKNNQNKIFLTDIFTVYTEDETINPWFFSPSWQKLLDIQVKENLNSEFITNIIKKLKPTVNWKTDWDNYLKDFYQKEYKDLPEEIKSILTTTFVVNIFSLLTKVKIAETNSSIFTIVKANTKQYLTGFDTLKIGKI